jgi:hypothetical protein
MFWLKACPRCRGDLFAQSRETESPFSCLQCGHEVQREVAVAILRRARARGVALSA